MLEPTNADVLAKLDEISKHLGNLDRRDRQRMAWSTIRTALHGILVVLAISGAWYFFAHIGEMMKTLAQESVKQTMQSAGDSSSTFWQEMKGYFGR